MVDSLYISNLLLWIVVVIMGVIIFALARQVGVLYERVAPAGALMLNSRLKVGQGAPEIEVLDMEGTLHHVGGVSPDGLSTLLFFLSPTCPLCKTLLPVVKSAVRTERSWLQVILASDGGEGEHREFIENFELERIPYVNSAALGITYGVSRLPYAVLIDEAGTIASLGIINSREHLESLFESKERGVASIQEYLDRQA